MGYFGDTIYVDNLKNADVYDWEDVLDSYGYDFITYPESSGRYIIIEIDTRSVNGKDEILQTILIEMEADGAEITYI